MGGLTTRVGQGLVLSWLLIQGYLSPFLLAQTARLPQPELITDRQGLPQAFVPSIVQDRQGFIWAATRDGLCRYDGRRFKVFQPNPDGRPSLSFTGLEKLVLDHHGKIWISYDHSDIDVFDPRTETFINISRQADYRRLMPNLKLEQFHIDRRERLWGGLREGGLICFDQKASQVRHFRHHPNQPGSLSSDSVMNVGESANGTLWIATRSGLDRFVESTHQFVHYQHQVGNPNSLPDNQLIGLFIQPNGKILLVSQQYVSTFDPRTGQFRSYRLPIRSEYQYKVNFAISSQGILYFDRSSVLFRFTEQDGPQVVAQWSKQIDQCSSLHIDRSDVLWIGTNGSGIQKYDLRPNPFETEPYRRNFYLDLLTERWLGIPASRLTNPAAIAGLNSYNFRYTIDQGQTLWCNVGSSDVYQIDLKAKRTDKVPLPIPFYEGDNINAIPCPLATDPQNRVWAIHDSLIWWFDRSKRQWITFPHAVPIRQTTPVITFVADEQALWLATRDGGLWRLDKSTGRLRQFVNQPGNSASLSSNALFCLSDDPTDSNRLWIGTFGGGLCAFDKRKGTCRRFMIREGLPNNVIYSVIPDQHGYLWMGTNKGICRMNRKTYQTKTYTRTDGLLADEFNRFHWLHLPGLERRSDGTAGMPDHDDRIIMGGLEGITAFDPKKLVEDPFDPPVELTSLQINDRIVQPGPNSPLGNLPIQAIAGLTLPYNQNFITADFAVLQFNSPGKNRYRYRLEGLENSWKETDQPVATYTNLPPDDYVLAVNASNTSGQWSRHIRRLRLTIQPPLWATWWAYLLYGLGAIGLVFMIIRSYVNRLKLRQAMIIQRREVELKQQEAQQLRQVDEMKTRFFSNITHEFRTPLTLILAPTHQLQQAYPEPAAQRGLRSIEKNAYQLLELINQLLDLSKLESNAMSVSESRGELGVFVETMVQSFQEQAESRQITLHYQHGLTEDYWFDRSKLERIVYNLVANAIKFTPVGGSIQVDLQPVDGVQLTIADTGIGIPADQVPYIFDRFYQVDDSNTKQSEGTGIGLALVNELVSVQQGRIELKSELGIGTTFVVQLPYQPVQPGSYVDESEPMIAQIPNPAGLLSGIEFADAHDSQIGEPTDDQPVVLLVEDNDELAQFIGQSLPSTYRVHRASNGVEGVEQALSLIPDLIISDVLMPQMDGYELTQRLKADLRTNHIPIILLTAKASVDSRLQGLSLGADDYLTKPFMVTELQLRVRNLLDRQRHQRNHLKALLNTLPESVTETDVVPDNNPFVENIYRILDTNLDDSTFGAEELASEIGMSRGHLYRKLKALTDLSVNEVIRNYRLKRAGQYLRLGHPVAETGYMVGFESPSYFTKCFRELYGLPPSDYLARQN